ncbi:phosphodiester glycosidase family protein [Leptodesmis sichuanensis]|uniref:phosphodiester glycosidase family protein n=1 Tax=Leptodesmis sichuanensis TaxID=2906798 RepID=UPI001F2C3FC8|nr:phosphodiester glycosidase family protein [Leptodesmis sichuanensis]UIE39439.1 phosphodiester glycosidase family protein [Leptodesmis sichuanensis A121]
MDKIRVRIFGFMGMGMLVVACSQSLPLMSSSPTAQSPVSLSPVVSPSPAKIEFKVERLPDSIVYTLHIPNQGQYLVTPGVANTIEPLASFVQTYGAIAAINGGFFDPKNQKSTSAAIVQARQVAKPEDNERLMTNPDLLPYLDKILNRSEFRQYRCGSQIVYDITLRQTLPAPGCELESALGGGPQLLPDITLVQEGFQDISNGKVIRDSLASDRRNARSAIGITRDGAIVLVMVGQKPNAPTNSGMTLKELTHYLKSLKVQKAMNLDGGSSAALYYGGETIYGKVNESGEAVQRPVKSALLVQMIKKQ